MISFAVLFIYLSIGHTYSKKNTYTYHLLSLKLIHHWLIIIIHHVLRRPPPLSHPSQRNDIPTLQPTSLDSRRLPRPSLVQLPPLEPRLLSDPHVVANRQTKRRRRLLRQHARNRLHHPSCPDLTSQRHPLCAAGSAPDPPRCAGQTDHA